MSDATTLPVRDDPRDRLIVALDVPTHDAALGWVDRLGERVSFYKVGLELFTACGPKIIEDLVARQKRVFLDLKLHDIPNTVAATVRVLARTGAHLTTLHASGGPAMLKAAVEAVEGSHLKLLAVTVLTSLSQDDLAADGHGQTLSGLVELRSMMAKIAGVHGIVCSPLEAQAARQIVGPDRLIVTPGVRAAGPRSDDQQRTATAAAAIAAGASHVVVGRPITQADDPLAAVDAILTELAS